MVIMVIHDNAAQCVTQAHIVRDAIEQGAPEVNKKLGRETSLRREARGFSPITGTTREVT